MHKINQTPSMRFTMKSTCLSITLAGVLLGSLLTSSPHAPSRLFALRYMLCGRPDFIRLRLVAPRLLLLTSVPWPDRL